MSKQLTLIFMRFDKEHLGKDVFLVPYTIGEKYGFDVTIVYPTSETNADLPSTIRGVKLHPIKPNRRLKWLPMWRTLPFYWYLIKNAQKIDFLMRFHHQVHTHNLAIIYKWLNKNGFMYVKFDGFSESLKKSIMPTCRQSWLNKMRFNKFVKIVDCFSIETIKEYKDMINCGNERFTQKLRLLPNGFDEQELQRLGIKDRTFQDKENLMITVGRLGTHQKNTELILDSLDGIDMKDWKLELIGPIEDNFNPKIEEFYKRNPDKINKVKFTGPIYDKVELWEHYNRAKVFILSSRAEGYPLVFSEARRFKNFFITTKVGGAEDITESEQFGHIINNEDKPALRKEILNVISGHTDINVYNSIDSLAISWDRLIERLELDQIQL